MKKLIMMMAAMMVGFSALAQEVDSSKSEFKWTGKKVSGQHHGKVPLKSAQVKTEKGEVVGGEFVLDLTQVTCEDLSGEWHDKFLAHIKNEDFFNVEKWPTARLVVNKLDGKMAHGQLTIKDKTNKVSFPYKKNGNVYSGTLTFDRTKYGMVYGSGDFFKGLGDKMIYNDVTLDFKVTVTPAK